MGVVQACTGRLRLPDPRAGGRSAALSTISSPRRRIGDAADHESRTVNPGIRLDTNMLSQCSLSQGAARSIRLPWIMELDVARIAKTWNPGIDPCECLVAADPCSVILYND